MSAVVIALSTPHFTATATPDGSFHIPHVPPGSIGLEFGMSCLGIRICFPSRAVEITPGDTALTTMTVHASDAPHDHLNKYGEPYPLDKPSKY